MTHGAGGSDAVILLAAGKGTRMEGVAGDKILVSVRGRTLFSYSVEAFAATGLCADFIVVYRDASQRAALEEAVAASPGIGPEQVHWTPGGNERQDSVCRGIELVPPAARTVFIHDCARPLVLPETVIELARLAREDGAACLAHRITDTVKRAADATHTRRLRLEEIDRSRLWATETPQAFEHQMLRRAYRDVSRRQLVITDDAAAVSRAGIPVTLLETPYPNPKLTRPRDLAYITFLLSERDGNRREQPVKR